MKIDVTLSIDVSLARRLDDLISIARQLSLKQDTIMNTLQDIIDDVEAEKTEIESLSVFVKGLQDKIKALPGLTAAQQAQIDGIFTAVEANKAAIAAAMVTPAA